MSRDEKLRIDYTLRLSWKVRLTTFVGIFSVIWLFIDPLPALGVIPLLLPTTGVWVYISLIVLGLIGALAAEYINRIRLSGRITYIIIELILTETGMRYLIEAPQDMRVEIFMDKLLNKLSKNAPPGTTIANAFWYNNTLLVNRNGNYEAVNGKITIREAGLVDNDICKIYGVIRPMYSSTNYMILWESKKMRKVRDKEEQMIAVHRHFTKISAKLAETEDGRELLKEYQETKEYKPEWVELGLPDRKKKEYQECQEEWIKLKLPDPWDNPKVF